MAKVCSRLLAPVSATNPKRRLLLSALLMLLCATVVSADDYNGTKFDRGKCLRNIASMQQAPGFSKNTPEYFLSAGDSLYNDTSNMTVTYKGCLEFCGKGTFYWDVGPRLTTWILPVVLLLSNIELSPIDKNRFMTVIHALGDPIDSFWSIIHKIYIWHRLYLITLRKSETSGTVRHTRSQRAQIIATVLAGFEEISGSRIESEDFYHMVTHQLGNIGEGQNENPEIWAVWCHAALLLADARTYEFWRTLLAMIVYIFGLIAAFVPSIGGGNTSTPGGRIASALFLSWLIPLALLSNVVGTFTSRRTCLSIMQLFVTEVTTIKDEEASVTATSESVHQPAVEQQLHLEDIAEGHQFPARLDPNAEPQGYTEVDLIEHSSWDDYFQSLQWLGAIYTYRPWKVLYLDIDHRTHVHRKSVMMFIGGLFPITLSAVSAFIILWNAVPVGFSCRHIWVITIFACWLLSAALTSMLYIQFKIIDKGPRLWKIILCKDAIIGISSLLLIFLSTGGAFNNCSCWSTDPFRHERAHVPLNWTVGSVVAAQILFFTGVLVWSWHGVKLVRWTEESRRREWKYVMTEDVQYQEDTYLLFWYKLEELNRQHNVRHQSQVEANKRRRRRRLRHAEERFELSSS